MSYTLFISDLHLDPARPEHLAALERLLEEHAGKTDALYVLGDLFEAWIGDDDDAPFNRQAIDAFRRFFSAMLDEGVYLAPSAYEAGFMSSAHTPEDIQFTLDAAEKAFAAMQRQD